MSTSRAKSQCRFPQLLFIVTMTMSTSGCLHALGLARPSLGPRTALLDVLDDSTVRSQDDLLTGNWDGPAAESSKRSDASTALNHGQQPAANHPSGRFGHSDFAASSSPNVSAVRAHLQAPEIANATLSTVNVQTPQARLLVPEFRQAGSAPHVAPMQHTLDGSPFSEAPSSADSTITAGTPNTAASTTDTKLGFSANQIRDYLNSQSQNAMSEGHVLAERPARWNILSADTAAERSSLSDSAISPGALFDNPSMPIFSVQPPNSQPNAADQPVPKSSVESVGISESPVASVSSSVEVVEPSMLDRLKGFYDTGSESSARKMWKRPFQRLPNPWNVFRDRQEPVPEEPTSPLPEQTVDAALVPDSGASDSSLLLIRLIQATAEELKNWPLQANGIPQDITGYQRSQQNLRLLYLIAEQPGNAIQTVDGLPPGEQEFWQELMLAMAEYRSEDGISRDVRLTSTAGQLRSALRQLSPLSSLGIRRFEICSRIHSFGRIDTFPANHFDPGQPLLLYAEIENFTTERTPAGSHSTRFDAQLQIFEEGNDKPKETIDLANIADEATSERSDYYQSFELNLPSHLKGGQYSIRLRLRDRNSGKMAEAVVEFQVR